MIIRVVYQKGALCWKNVIIYIISYHIYIILYISYLIIYISYPSLKFLLVSNVNIYLTVSPHHSTAQKKDKDRRKGKGRRCCLRGRVYSIPSRASSYFAKDQFEEQDEVIFFFQIILGQFNGLVQNSQRSKDFNIFFPPNRSDDLFLCLYPSAMVHSKI